MNNKSFSPLIKKQYMVSCVARPLYLHRGIVAGRISAPYENRVWPFETETDSIGYIVITATET